MLAWRNQNGVTACSAADPRNLTARSNLLFEAAAVRPLALNGKRLPVTNTPANCQEICRLRQDRLELEQTVMVGMAPVAVAFASPTEAWVVNHLSDSVSIVALDGTPRVVRTLQVGDEPRDLVFAGSRGQRAFITAAYRGQNHPEFDPEDLLTPGLGGVDVWINDRSGVGTTLFNLAVNPASGELYASNLEALNHIRCEGPGESASTMRGHIAESGISVLDESGAVHNHLNPHVAFDVPEGATYPAEVAKLSLSQPTAMALSPGGDRLYLAAFVGLVGRSEELDAADMQAFTDFAMALTPPPNPVRRLDISLVAAEARGENIYFNATTTGLGGRNHCHTLDPAQKHFGTIGLMSFEG